MAGDAFDYDLLVIGSGPAGQRAAIQAPSSTSVAIVERRPWSAASASTRHDPQQDAARGGAAPLGLPRARCTALVHRQAEHHHAGPAVSDRPGMEHEIDVMRHQLMRNGVELIAAEARSSIRTPCGSTTSTARTARTVTRAQRSSSPPAPTPTRDAHIPFDGQRIFTSDDVLHLERLPRTLAVVGAGVIGLRVRQHLRHARRAGHAGRQAPAPAAVRRRARSSTRWPTTCARTASPCGSARRSAHRAGRGRARRAGQASTSPAASRSSPTRRSTASAAPARPQAELDRLPAWQPTTAGGSRSTSTTRPTCRTSTRSAT